MHTGALINTTVTSDKVQDWQHLTNVQQCNSCINNSKQRMLKEAMAMHILNASSESVVSCLGSTTVHWSVQLGSEWSHVPHS